MSLANTEIPNWQTPEGLAATPTWLTWLTDPAQRLLAATAYRAYPDQSKPAKGSRFEAAVLALGYRAEVAAVFRDGPTTPERAEATLTYRAEQKVQQEKWAAEQAEAAAKEEKFNRSAAGRRRARALKQGVLEVHYCNDDFGVLYVTNKVFHKLMASPVGNRLMAFNSGTLGEPSGTNDHRIFQSYAAARRVVCQRLYKLNKKQNTGLGGIVGMRMQGWKENPAAESETAQKIQAWFDAHILPWVKKTLKK